MIGRKSLVAAAFAALVLLRANALAQPLNQRVLVVYNANNSDSQTIANYYANARGIPAANLCAITPSDPSGITYAEYTGTVRGEIQACLNAVGPQSILYIVLSYMTPYSLVVSNSIGGYAVDSFVADIWDKYTTQIFNPAPTAVHSYHADAQSEGEVFKPFMSFASWRAQLRSPLIYSVWRLDGPAAPPPASDPLQLVKGLVDNAIYAETHGLTGVGCFDMRFDPTPVYDMGATSGDWDLYRAAGFVSSAGFTVIQDFYSTEFGTPPSGRCDGSPDGTIKGAALYSGWYSLYHYNDAFTWNPGSVGFHLDSASAVSPRTGPSWVPNALSKGITVTSGSVNEPYLQGLARPGGLFRNLLEGANVGDAFLRNTRWLKWMILNVGDPLYTPFQGGVAGFPPPVISLALSPMELVGGFVNSTATLTLPFPAPWTGMTFTLSSNDPTQASVPASVTVPGGSNHASFTVTTHPDPGGAVFIAAASGSTTVQNTLVIDPMLAGVGLSQTTVSGGQTVTAAVFLNDRAPLGGLSVSLTSSNPAVAPVPAAITVAAGQTSAQFSITTTTVSSSQQVTIGAAYGPGSSSAVLTVNP